MSKRIKPLSEAEKREMRRLFPFLVAMAKNRIPPMVYSQITDYTDIHYRKWLGRALGNIRDPKILYRLLDLQDPKRRPENIPDYPDINSLAINTDGAPGSEWPRDPAVWRAYRKLTTVKERIDFVRPYQMDVYRYDEWDDIVADLGLTDVLFTWEKLLTKVRPDCTKCVFHVLNDLGVK